MGSLKVLQQVDSIHHDYHKIGVSHKSPMKKKPLQMLLGMIKSTDMDPNHSPLESPPIEKKRLRRISNNNGQGSPRTARSTTENKENMSEEKLKEFDFEHPVSILKKIIRPTVSVARAHPTKCSHDRKVLFNAEVTVKFIGESGTCLEPLVECRDRNAFIARNMLRRSKSQDLQESHFVSGPDSHYHLLSQCGSAASGGGTPISSSTLQPCQSTSQLPVFHNNPIYKSTTNATHSTSEQGKNVSISFTQSSRSGSATMMKFVVFMGAEYDPNNIVVKANMSGNRLRVVADKVNHQRGGGGTKGGDLANEQYNERFQLPMQVDPYKVEARLDNRGYLTVDAPLVSGEVHSKAIEQKSGSISV